MEFQARICVFNDTTYCIAMKENSVEMEVLFSENPDSKMGETGFLPE